MNDSVDVCLLTTGFPRWRGDSFGVFVFGLARALARAGLRVQVVAPHERGLPVREEMDGVRVERFRYALRPCLAYGDGIPTNIARRRSVLLQVPGFLLAFWWQARRASRRARVLHAQWTISGFIAWLGAWPGRVPVVLTVRGSDLKVMHTGLLARVHAFTYARVARVLAVSDDIAATLRANGVGADRVQMIPNGVDESFHPADREAARLQLGLPSDVTILLFVGMLVPVKGLDVLLTALARVQTPCHCVLVGDGEERQALARQAIELGIEERVQLVGARAHDEIPTWMAAADLFVLPSRSEGRPNVVLEAQACGLPVVATRVGGTPELVCPDTGRLVAAEDADELTEALSELLGSESLRRQLG